MKQPEILILDDSASALDFATDAKLRKAIKEKTKGMTVFIVSQRASTIKQADQIIVLEDGAMAGIGTHEELLKSCGVYKEIVESQADGATGKNKEGTSNHSEPLQHEESITGKKKEMNKKKEKKGGRKHGR